jgi:hypothetical protein
MSDYMNGTAFNPFRIGLLVPATVATIQFQTHMDVKYILTIVRNAVAGPDFPPAITHRPRTQRYLTRRGANGRIPRKVEHVVAVVEPPTGRHRVVISPAHRGTRFAV